MWIEVGIVGTSIGVALGILMEYWDKQEYNRNFKRNLRGLQNENRKRTD